MKLHNKIYFILTLLFAIVVYKNSFAQSDVNSNKANASKRRISKIYNKPRNELFAGTKLSINFNKHSVADASAGARSVQISNYESGITSNRDTKLKNQKEIENNNDEIQKNTQFISQVKDKLTKIPSNNLRITEQEFNNEIAISQGIIGNITDQEIERIEKLIQNDTEKLREKNTDLSAQNTELDNKIQKDQDRLKLLKSASSIAKESSKISLNFGLSGGFQANRDKFSFAGSLDLDFGKNEILNGVESKNSFGYSLIGRVGYDFIPTFTGYVFTGLKFANYKVSYSTEDETVSKSIKQFVFGGGVEKRILQNLSIFADIGYYTSLDSIELRSIVQKVDFTNFQLSAGIRYYFDAKNVSSMFKRSKTKK